jgi:hypothetical protein
VTLLSDSERPKPSGGARGARIVAAMIAVFCLIFGLSYLYTGFQNGDQISIIVGFLIFSFFFSLIGSAWRAPVVNPLFRTVSVIKCDKCQYTEVRDFQRGDYMYKTLGKCKECEGEMFIRSIYTIPIQKTQLQAS